MFLKIENFSTMGETLQLEFNLDKEILFIRAFVSIYITQICF